MSEGRHAEQFTVDVFEGAGGTSLNMNVNEVLANRGLQLMGREAGDYAALHPNDHVNLSQSTNDVVPSAIKIAAHALAGVLSESLEALEKAFAAKASEFDDALRLGRTCLQDAQPMRLGQAFGAYAAMTRRLAGELSARRAELLALPLGATAIGTGLGAPPGFRERVLAELSAASGIQWNAASDPFDALANSDTFARLSAELRTIALAVAKIGDDLIVLASGPSGGIAEIVLPPLQAGSSIMPGKVNPVMPMTIVQLGFVVAGNDATIAAACARGQLEIISYEPAIAARLFESLRVLSNGLRLFAEKCIAEIGADRERMLRHLLDSSAIATALVPEFGYEKVSALVRRAYDENRPFLAVAEELGVLSRERALELVQANSGR